MAISLVNSASANSTNLTDVTSLVISKPTNTASGDFMIAIVVAHATANITSSGWTQVSSETDSAGTRLKTWFLTKTAGGSEPSTYTFSWSGGSSAAGGVITYRGSNGLATPGLGTQPQVTNSLADPKEEPGTFDVSQPYMAGYALVWHDTRAGGSPAVTATGSTGTELWDRSTIDGPSSTHERGMAAYSKTGIQAEMSSSFGATINPTQTIDGCVAWSWSVAERPYVTGAAAHSGATASGTGTVSSSPTGSGSLLHSGATAAGTAYEYPTIDGAALHSGATAAGVAYEWPLVDGAVLHSGAVAEGVAYEWPTIDGACVLGGAQAAGVANVEGTKLEIKVNGVWTDITEKLRHSEGVTVTRGKTSAGSNTPATTCTFRLDNREHEFNPFNANGAYYGYLNRNTEIRLIKQEVGTRFHGEVSSYAFGTDRSGNDLYVDVECAGILRRLEQGETPIGTAFKQGVQAVANVGGVGELLQYWPCEDGKDSQSLAAVDTNQFTAWDPAASVANIRVSNLNIEGGSELGAYDGFKCSSPIPQIGNSKWHTTANPHLNSTSGLISFLFASPGGMTVNGGVGGLETNIIQMTESGEVTANTGFIRLSYTGTNQYTIATGDGIGGNSTAATIKTVGRRDGVLFYIGWDNHFVHLWYQFPGDSEPTLAATVDNTGGAPYAVSTPMYLEVNSFGVEFSDASSAYLGHICVWKNYDEASPVLPDLTEALDAYNGEYAATRFARLCADQGITSEIEGVEAESARMGYQGAKRFTELLRECEDTDQGLMYEIRDGLGLGYRTRASLYNQAATLTLDYEGGHLIDEFKPMYDDKDVVNDMTLTREGGASARYEVTTGRMNTSPAPDGIGRYDSSVSVSLFRDEDAYTHAGWRCHIGAVDEVRISSLRTGLELPSVEASDAKQVEILTINLGDRIVVQNPPPWMPDEEIDQILQGYTERWDPTEHRWTYNTSPGSPYRVAQATAAATSTTQAKTGSLTTTLNEDLDTTETSVEVAISTGSALWTTSGVDFDVIVGGEVMTVTAVSGASSPQTFTVTRSVNGVVKSHSSGARVVLHKPAITAL